MSRKTLYLIIFLSAVALRGLMLFRQELIPGVNGGYYPLQVRSLLENGQLGFADMPLYFWFNAFWAKALSLASATPVERWIIPVVKVVDAIFLPLLLIPLYRIASAFPRPARHGFWWESAVALFAVASPWPLMFTGDLQKNAFAIPFFFAFLLLGWKYLRRPSPTILWGGALCLLLTGLAHFGVFAVTVLALGLGLVFYAPRRALFPLLGLALLSTALVALFDPGRAWRLLTVVGELFYHPALLGPLGPPELLAYLLAWLLLGLGGYVLFRHRAELAPFERVALLTLLALLFLLSFPFLNGDYARRLMLMLFVPQSILCLFLFRWLPPRWSHALAAGLFILCLAFSPGALHLKQPVLTQDAYDGLKELRSQLPLDKNTLIIARHGLEWWAGWALHCKTGNEKGVDEDTPGQYGQVLFLHQEKGKEAFGPAAPNGHPGFREPEPPFGELVEIAASAYFQVYVWRSR